MKMKYILLVLTLISSTIFAKNLAIDPDNLYPQVKFETSMGVVVVELDRVRAPLTVDNFLTYVVKGEYNNTIFHRVIADFIVQGGGFEQGFITKSHTHDIHNESGNGLKNDAGTIAMARLYQPHSANRQFFFNVKDNDGLNPGKGWGYTVFGYITEGEEIVDAISKVPTDIDEATGWPDVPVEPVILLKATLLAEQ